MQILNSCSCEIDYFFFCGAMIQWKCKPAKPLSIKALNLSIRLIWENYWFVHYILGMISLTFTLHWNVWEVHYSWHHNVLLTMREAFVMQIDSQCSTKVLVLRIVRYNSKACAYKMLKYLKAQNCTFVVASIARSEWKYKSFFLKRPVCHSRKQSFVQYLFSYVGLLCKMDIYWQKISENHIYVAFLLLELMVWERGCTR